MGRFFANQKLDEAGIVGISLQKLLIFFMFLDVTWLVLGYSFFGPFMSFLFHFVVLMGVYRRRTCVLLIYGVFNTVIFILAGVALLFLMGAVMTADNQPADYSSSSGAPQSVNYSAYLRRTLFSASSSESSSDSYGSSDNSEDVAEAVYLAAVIAMVISFIILYCKIYSTVLAFRMRKLLLAADAAPVLPTEQPKMMASDCDSDVQPLLSEEQAFENVHPLFAQPGFVPYPMPQFYPGNVQGSAMMPPPFMYGQHPVFYTFAPFPQPPADEKL